MMDIDFKNIKTIICKGITQELDILKIENKIMPPPQDGHLVEIKYKEDYYFIYLSKQKARSLGIEKH